MIALWNNNTATAAASGACSGQWQAGSVSIDTRTLQPGALYVAIKGERLDGHAFVADAFAKGAAAAMVSAPVNGVPQEKLLVVGDTLKGLQALGAAARERTPANVIGLTGSVGKTSAKDMLRLMLSAFGRTYANTGNLNNHIGTPLTLANMPPDTDYAVIEMGMNHAGEIEALTRMVKPHVAIITNVEAVHLEFFDSVEAIADAKSEIFSGITEGGTVILNHENAHYQRCREHAEVAGVTHIVAIGREEGADVRLTSMKVVADGMRLAAEVAGERVEYRLAAVGEHWAMTSMMALAAAKALGLDVHKAADALAGFSEGAGRGRIVEIAVPGGKAWLVDDSYNASPASMRAAFKRAAILAEGRAEVTRKIAVLGDMLELGEQASAMHAALAEDLQEAGFGVVYTVGPLMAHLHQALPALMHGMHTEAAGDLLPTLKESLAPGDMVLMKGSHGSHIHSLAAAFLPPPACGGR